LRSGGNFLVKVFQGGELETFLSEVKKRFRKIRVIRPRATRKSSSEIYILGLGFLEES